MIRTTLAALALTLPGVMLLNASAAHAIPVPVHDTSSTWHEPYGGCDEAALYPGSRGARECHAHGF